MASYLQLRLSAKFAVRGNIQHVFGTFGAGAMKLAQLRLKAAVAPAPASTASSFIAILSKWTNMAKLRARFRCILRLQSLRVFFLWRGFG